MATKKTLKQRRATDRARQKRFRERNAAEGNKTILAIISPTAQIRLLAEKSHTGETYSQIIERLIMDGLESRLVKRQEGGKP